MTARRTVAGRYELTSPIGHGGMGEVWAGYDKRLDRKVAVKLLRASALASAGDPRTLVRRFEREARLTARVENQGVPAVFDAGTENGELYVVMQLVEGHDLGDVIAERGALPIDLVAGIGAQAAGVLAAAHAVSLVHRDLKPRNIMLCPDGMVKILDFGVAALLDSETTRLTRTGETVGSPAYMAPEQVLNGVASPRTDLYSLGCLLHELLAGRQVFAGDAAYSLMYQHVESPPTPLRQIRADVPEPIERLVLDLLAKDPERRPADAQQVFDRLVPFIPGPETEPRAGEDAERGDPCLPFTRPLAPRPKPSRSQPPPADRAPAPAAPPGVNVTEARSRARELVDAGRFTQAAELLSAILVNASRDNALDLRIDLAAALVLGSDYRGALPHYERLVDDLTAQRGGEDDLVLRCQAQLAVCQVETGELTEAQRNLRAVVEAQQRRLAPQDTELMDLRRQLALLQASTGDIDTAIRNLESLLYDQARLLGTTDPAAAETRELLDHLREMSSHGSSLS